MHKIFIEDNCKPNVQPQRPFNSSIQEVLRKEMVKLMDTSIIYLISNNKWISLVQIIPKKDGITMVKNDNNDLIPTRTVTG